MTPPADHAETLHTASPIQASRTVYRIDLQRHLGPLTLNVNFTLTAPWTVLFAPSGAGKSTLLRMLAGLDRPDQGRILRQTQSPHQPQQDLVLTDTASRIFVPAHQRSICMVAQRPALFPHLSVLRNVQYGNRQQQSPTASLFTSSFWRSQNPRSCSSDQQDTPSQTASHPIPDLCRITHLLHKTPAHLSGGEAQRVALARALSATGSSLLLLDEPFTGLETTLREDILRDLRPYLASRGIPVLQVTHDIGEVFSTQAQVLRMEAGKIIAQGPAQKVLAQERHALLAQLQR